MHKFLVVEVKRKDDFFWLLSFNFFFLILVYVFSLQTRLVLVARILRLDEKPLGLPSFAPPHQYRKGMRRRWRAVLWPKPQQNYASLGQTEGPGRAKSSAIYAHAWPWPQVQCNWFEGQSLWTDGDEGMMPSEVATKIQPDYEQGLPDLYTSFTKAFITATT